MFKFDGDIPWRVIILMVLLTCFIAVPIIWCSQAATAKADQLAEYAKEHHMTQAQTNQVVTPAP